jgi:hypothetical protein
MSRITIDVLVSELGMIENYRRSEPKVHRIAVVFIFFTFSRPAEK